MEYIEKCDSPGGCIFCEKPRQNKDKENLIVFRGDSAFVIMNRYPYNNGHLMVVPYRHTSELTSLRSEEKTEMMDLLIVCQNVLNQVMQPHGFNVGMNIGRVAGAGIADHIHFHIVPRWDGDTNFMPILGHSKVVSEALEQTWAKLNDLFSSFACEE
ncbi:HIT domain-containing protein [bacterium]|nr:HIT domain-containing protein [bacterium]